MCSFSSSKAIRKADRIALSFWIIHGQSLAYPSPKSHFSFKISIFYPPTSAPPRPPCIFRSRASLFCGFVYLLLKMERDFPKHWKECELGKRTPEEKQNFRRSVKEGSGTRDQMNSALLLSTWDSSWSCGFPGLQGLQPGSMCAFAFQKETHGLQGSSAREELHWEENDGGLLVTHLQITLSSRSSDRIFLIPNCKSSIDQPIKPSHPCSVTYPL